jgi:hypothetical protein
MKITPAASSAARIAARLPWRQRPAAVLEVGDGVARDGSARQFGLTNIDEPAGGAALRPALSVPCRIHVV